jgi:proline dehydrogenase
MFSENYAALGISRPEKACHNLFFIKSWLRLYLCSFFFRFYMPLSFDNTRIAFQYRNNKDLKLAHFLFLSMSSPLITKMGITIMQYAIKWKLPVKGLIKNTIFKQFCGGEGLQEAAATAAILGRYRVSVALDYGVEGKESEAEFDRAVPEFINAIEYAASQPNIPFIPVKVTGFARFGLLEKLQSKAPLSEAEQSEWERVKVRIDKICAAASEKHLMILIDAEQSWIQEPVDALTDAMMEKYNRHAVVVFNTFQMYRHDRLDFLKRSFKRSKASGYILGAKLVRGAYMEKERARAAERNYPSPIQPDKESTDADYDAAVDFCLANLDLIALFIGTHNETSCMKAAAYMQSIQVAPSHPRVFFAQLYGMSDNITFNLADAGYQVSKYLPYGPVEDVVPYMMRRAQENTSVAGQTSREFALIKKEMRRRGI